MKKIKVFQKLKLDLLNSILNSSSISGLTKINKENIPMRAQTPDIYRKNIKSS